MQIYFYLWESLLVFIAAAVGRSPASCHCLIRCPRPIQIQNNKYRSLFSMVQKICMSGKFFGEGRLTVINTLSISLFWLTLQGVVTF